MVLYHLSDGQSFISKIHLIMDETSSLWMIQRYVFFMLDIQNIYYAYLHPQPLPDIFATFVYQTIAFTTLAIHRPTESHRCSSSGLANSILYNR